ncbi:MAG: aminotransferase class V-fold PLP-dependent enzyme [Alphaproteobacteria bacterium]|nr:aminotransferase class V-fold PLP-dependent enzyme [Alphaproteobacteria bacterium]
MNKIIYLDAAASALKPDSVIKAERDFLQKSYANSGRGVCARSVAVDNMVKHAREKVAEFINAESNQVVFTSGATDGLNRIVNILTSQPWYNPSANFAVSDLDHHSARLPWEALLHHGKIRKLIKCDLDKNLDIAIDSIPKTDFFVITAMSNVLGRAQDVKSIIAAARKKNPNVITIVDASQYVVHNKINVQEWDCDFMVFSGHKIGADTGVGVLYIRDTKKYFPDKFGGGMVLSVADMAHAKESRGGWIYQNCSSCWVTADAPEKWEAGTLPLTQIVGLVPAIDYLESNRPNLDLIKYLYDELSKIKRVKLLTLRDSALLSFIVDGMHPLDIGALLGVRNICVRVGNMCASWVHKYLGVPGTVRISVGAWNTMDDVIQTAEIIKQIVK